jgi:NAD(P)H dehydrogenase (quinone)
MTTIAIVYHSGTGHTARMAEAVAQGAKSVPDTEVQLLKIEGRDIIEGRFKNEALLAACDQADALIFGSPTYMGMVSGQFKAFADATGGRWYGQAWKDKLAAGFTVSSGLNGDKLSTLHYLFTLAMQHGMLWAGLPGLSDPNGVNRLGCNSGAMGQAGQEPPDIAPNALDLATGQALGQRVAEATKRWQA